MKRLAARAAKHVLFAAGHYARALSTRRFPGIAVLGYHAVLSDDTAREQVPFSELHVSAATLDAHLTLIAAHCDPVSLADACAIWAGTVPCPARAVLVTFDDGHRGVLTHAAPLLARHRVPATMFVCTGPVARGTSFWFDAMARAEGEAAVEAAKSLPWEAWRARVTLVERVAALTDPVAPCTIDEIRQLAAHPMITLGAHTESHPILANAPVEVQRDEIVRSVEALDDWTGTRPLALAYPNGRPRIDFTTVTEEAAARAGIATAFSTRPAFAGLRGTPLARPRFVMLSSIDAPELAHRLAYSWTEVA